MIQKIIAALVIIGGGYCALNNYVVEGIIFIFLGVGIYNGTNHNSWFSFQSEYSHNIGSSDSGYDSGGDGGGDGGGD